MTIDTHLRYLLALLLSGLLPFLFLGLYIRSKTHELHSMQSQIQQIEENYLISEQKKSHNALVKEYYKEADRFYLNKYVESLALLGREKEQLEEVQKQRSVAEDPSIMRRLQTIQANKLVFSEGSMTSYTLFNEIPETLKPVEVDSQDIREILAKIEGVEIEEAKPGPNRPQLLITDFRIDRQEDKKKSANYQLTLKLIKREYLSEPQKKL